MVKYRREKREVVRQMKNQNGFALALVILILVLVTTAAIPLALSSSQTNRQINKVEEVNAKKDDIEILLDLVVAKYQVLVNDANSNENIDFDVFKNDLTFDMRNFINNSLSYDSFATSITVNNKTYTGKNNIFSIDVIVNQDGLVVSQKVNFKLVSSGGPSTPIVLPGFSALNDFRFHGYLNTDSGFEFNVGNEFIIYDPLDFNDSTNHMTDIYVGVNNFYSEKCSRKTCIVKKSDIRAYPSLNGNSKSMVNREFNIHDRAPIDKIAIDHLLTNTDTSGWTVYNSDASISYNSLRSNNNFFVNGDATIDIPNYFNGNLSGKNFYATGDITFNGVTGGSKIYALEGQSVKFISGGGIYLNSIYTDNDVLNAAFIAETNITIKNYNYNENIDIGKNHLTKIKGIFHSNGDINIYNNYKFRRYYPINFYKDSSALDGILDGLGSSGNTYQVEFSKNPKK